MMMEETMHNVSAAPTDRGRASFSPAAAAVVKEVSEAALQDQQLFDVSLIQPSRRHHQYQQHSHYEEECHGQGASLPPMESLTMYTTDDDNTSVSSVSTQGSQQRRSMFSQYWKKTGQEPPRFLPRSSPSGASATAPPSAQAASTSSPFPGRGDDMPCAATERRGVLPTPPEYEAVMDIQVPSMSSFAAPSVAPKNCFSRRSMFPRCGGGGEHSTIRQSSSAPSLISYNENEEDASMSPSSSAVSGAPRKVRSYSHLLSKQPSSSCLRESRFSPNKNTAALRRASSSTSATITSSSIASAAGSSVRFDMDVTVLHFDPPQERYAHEGWSNYFQ